MHIDYDAFLNGCFICASSNLDENVKCKLCLVTFDTKKCFDLHTSLRGKIWIKIWHQIIRNPHLIFSATKGPARPMVVGPARRDFKEKKNGPARLV
jgi:hypothetical protein